MPTNRINTPDFKEEVREELKHLCDSFGRRKTATNLIYAHKAIELLDNGYLDDQILKFPGSSVDCAKLCIDIAKVT